ncbi:MAG: hypothetical protein OXG98_15585 [Gemmatimonadetes bacterium]|nr:hypothetical protein [Gemmatimonadota bacterium]
MQGLWASVFALTGTFVEIVSFAMFYTYVFLTLAVIGLIILRRKEPDLHRPYRVWGYPVTPVLFLLIAAGVLVNALIGDYTRPLLGLLILAIGLPFYFYWKRQQRANPTGG